MSNSSENEYLKFATRKWYVIEGEANGNYSYQNNMRFKTNSIESSLCDYSDADILVTGNIVVTRTIANAAVAGGNPQRKQLLDVATQVVFKNCAPFSNCRMEINDILILQCLCTNRLNLVIIILIVRNNEITNNADVSNDNNTPLFRYKSDINGNAEADGGKNGIKIAVPIKDLSDFWRLLEMPLINCKVELSLKWMENCVLTTAPKDPYANTTGADVATLEKLMQNFTFLLLLYQQ